MCDINKLLLGDSPLTECLPNVPYMGECCQKPASKIIEHKHTIRPMNKATYGGRTFEDTSECPVCNPTKVVIKVQEKAPKTKNNGLAPYTKNKPCCERYPKSVIEELAIWEHDKSIWDAATKAQQSLQQGPSLAEVLSEIKRLDFTIDYLKYRTTFIDAIIALFAQYPQKQAEREVEISGFMVKELKKAVNTERERWYKAMVTWSGSDDRRSLRQVIDQLREKKQ